MIDILFVIFGLCCSALLTFDFIEVFERTDSGLPQYLYLTSWLVRPINWGYGYNFKDVDWELVC